MSDQHCACISIDESQWDGKVHDFSDKSFYVKPVKYFFQAPMNVDAAMAEAADEIDKKGYMVEEPMMVLELPGRFSGALLIAIYPPDSVDPSVHPLPRTNIYSKVYHRKEAKIQPGVKGFVKELEKSGKKVQDLYLWHISCPQCGASQGYKTVILASL